MMKKNSLQKTPVDAFTLSHKFVEDAFDRVTGAELLTGNEVKLLIDARENYPAWLAAIEGARERIFFESYIIHEDEQGELFADALIKKARAGVEVKLLYDWLGGFGKTSRKFWRRLRQGGVDVRCYNPPRFLDPLLVLVRDHRKSLVVDGRIAFVTGLCVGQDWVGRPEKQMPAWRDTGVEIRGAAVADVEHAFANIWAQAGAPMERQALAKREDFQKSGSVALRVVEGVPSSSHIYRIDQLLAAGVRETMWITDAYFVGVPAYLQSIKDAAADGVDVRILVPQSTDIGLIRDTTRSTYRAMLESGVRVFEWNGSMIHAKTAVFDGRFARVGSTNLNIASWFGNYELDVLIEDEDFAKKMQEMFLKDLENSTEIVLNEANRTERVGKKQRLKGRGAGSVRKATAGAINAATAISAVITKQAALGAAEARLLAIVGGGLLILALLLIFFPRIASIPLVILLLILALPTLMKALKNYRNN
ncbi:MAG TPA: phospholipase D-like domain-containing protein [Pyrinomonadaceae bacterium]|jgi:cardiolipin synthase